MIILYSCLLDFMVSRFRITQKKIKQFYYDKTMVMFVTVVMSTCFLFEEIIEAGHL